MKSELQEALQRANTALSNEQQAKRDCQEQVWFSNVWLTFAVELSID